MDSAVRWLWRVTGRKKAYVFALTLIQGASGGLGVLYALPRFTEAGMEDVTEQNG